MGVIDFKQPHSPEVWISGRARCASCQHKHIAVARVGTDWLRCPNCKLYKSKFTNALLPDEPIWQCSCSCDVFHIVSAGFFCVGCGKIQRF